MENHKEEIEIRHTALVGAFQKKGPSVMHFLYLSYGGISISLVKSTLHNFWQESQGCEHSTRNYLSVGVQLREHIGTQSSKNNIFYT